MGGTKETCGIKVTCCTNGAYSARATNDVTPIGLYGAAGSETYDAPLPQNPLGAPNPYVVQNLVIVVTNFGHGPCLKNYLDDMFTDEGVVGSMGVWVASPPVDVGEH